MTNVFNIDKLDYSTFEGSCTIPVKIKGYWSQDTIKSYINIGYDTNRNKTLIPSIHHSSGGRDLEEESDNLVAAQNFAEAMLALVQYGKTLQNDSDKLIKIYNNYKHNRLVAEHLKEQERIAAIESDSIIGDTIAHNIVLTMRAKAKEKREQIWTPNEISRTFRVRGSTNLITIRCSDVSIKSVTFRTSNGSRISLSNAQKEYLIVPKC